MSQRLLRLRIATLGASSMSSTGGNVDLTFQNEIRFPPVVGGTVVVPLEGRTESRPWTVELLDNSNAVHANLSDSSGRMDLLGRLADFQTNTSSGGWTTIGTGRVSVIELTNDETFLVAVEDERIRERRSTIFTSQNTSQVHPPGLAQRWGDLRQEPAGRGLPMVKQNNALLVRFDLQDRDEGFILPSGVIDALVADLSSGFNLSPTATTGNFKTARLYHNSTAFEIFGFDVTDDQSVTPRVAQSLLQRFNARVEGTKRTFSVWIIDSSGKLGTPTGSRSDDWISGLTIRMDGSEPSIGMPLHIASSSNREHGIHPFRLLRKIYDGDYGGSTIRYSTAAMDTLENTAHYGRGFWRITEPANMAEWVEEHLYKPYGVVPLIGDDGKIVPTGVYLPAAGDVSTGTLFAFTSTNLSERPTWTHNARDLVTVVRGHYHVRLQRTPQEAARENLPSADRITLTEQVHEETHDRVANLGRFIHDVTIHGVANSPRDRSTPPAPALTKWLAKEVFERYGDGPIMGTLQAMDSASTRTVGSFAKVSLDTFPNPATTGRGGTRFVQLTGKAYTPAGPAFEYLDLGPNLGAVTAPAFTLTRSTVTPKHAAILDITSGIPTGGGWQSIIYSSNKSTATYTAPGTTVAGWRPGPGGTATGTHLISGLPSDANVSVRVRGIASNRIRSDWSAAATTGTSSIPAFSGVGTANIKAQTAEIQWTVGSVDYPIAVHVDATSTAALTSTNWVLSLLPRSTAVLLTGLNANDGHRYGIRHFDPYGGYGPGTVGTFNTLSTNSTNYAQAPTLRGVSIMTVGT